ncbi:MAG: trypsin-like serine peptidase, partial [Geminicoccaceae bacterium]
MIEHRTAVLSALALLFAGQSGMLHAGDGASAVRLLELEPFQGNPAGVIARAQPKTNPRAPSSITSIKPDAAAADYPAGAMTRDGAVRDTRRDFGSFGIPYTTTRVQEGLRGVDAGDANRLSTTYPYSAVGLLGDAESGGFCSASVIRRGIVLTAAHCLGGEDAESLIFWPGYYNGEGGTEETIAPYGIWNVFRAAVPESWTSPDSACVDIIENDLAILTMQRNEDGAFIGDLVGTLGYGWNNFSFISSENTGNLSVAAVTTLGYPGFMDNGEVMQRTDGPTYAVTASIPDLTGCEEGQQTRL